MSHPLTLTNKQARRLFLHGHGLLTRPTGPARRRDIFDIVDQLGFVQVDSINTIARAHDHILFARKPQYKPTGLRKCVAQDRTLFEGWTHDASILPSASFPYWRHKFERDAKKLPAQWKKWGREDFQKEFDQILQRLSNEGPLTATELANGDRQNGGGWWDWQPTKVALEFLWRTGEVSICHRRSFTKVYALTENVIPPAHLSVRKTWDETLEWANRFALGKLGVANQTELARFWDLASIAEAKDWVAQERMSGTVRDVVVAGHEGLRSGISAVDIEDQLDALQNPTPRLRILSPFDPALRDRDRIKRLFDFDYKIEVFVPEPKRKYGYYVFPILEGDQLTGRIDIKADRTAGIMNILGYWPEGNVSFGVARADRLAKELIRICAFSGCKKIDISPNTNTALLRTSKPFCASIG